MYIIVAPIQIKEGHREDFIKASVEDARASRAKEPGCVRFDIIQDAGDANRFWFYEVFTNEAAFKSHLNTPHVIKWRDTVQSWRVDGPKGAAPGSVNIWPTDDEWK